jgi:hypothetical protein
LFQIIILWHNNPEIKILFYFSRWFRCASVPGFYGVPTQSDRVLLRGNVEQLSGAGPVQQKNSDSK